MLTVVCGFFGMFQILYLNVDNYLLSLVINRLFDNDNYCMFVNPVICCVGGVFRTIFPDADGFLILTRLLLLAGIWCTAFLMTNIFQSYGGLLCGYLIIFLLVVNSSLFFDYFTIWAAFFFNVGMLLLLFQMRCEESRSQIILGTIFISCGFMWRIESALLLMPFLLLDLFVCIVFLPEDRNNRFRMIKRTCRIFLPSVICVSMLCVLDFGYKHSEKYAEAVEYNNALSTMLDFPTEDYENVKKMLPGVSENDYESLKTGLYADTELLSLSYVLDIADMGAEERHIPEWQEIIKTNKIIADLVLSSPKTMFYYLVLAILFLLILVSEHKWYYKLEAAVAFLGAYMILFYFAFIGRLPLRVFNSVTYGIYGIVLLLFWSIWWKKELHWISWIKRGLLVMIFLVLCVDTVTYSFVSPQTILGVSRNADENRWEDTYQDGEIYVWERIAYIFYPMENFRAQGKLMTEKFMEHNICAGLWIYHQVYFQNYLNRLGIPNPARALLERENTYYVAENEETMLVFLQEHYDEETIASQVGEIEGIPIWKFETDGQ